MRDVIKRRPLVSQQFIKAHPPISEENGNLTTLQIDIDLITIDALDEIAMTYKLKFGLQVL